MEKVSQIPVPSKKFLVKQNPVSFSQAEAKDAEIDTEIKDAEKQVMVVKKKKNFFFCFDPVKSFGNSISSSVRKELRSFNKKFGLALSKADVYHETAWNGIRVAENGVRVAENGVRVADNGVKAAEKMVFWFRGLVIMVGVIAVVHFNRNPPPPRRPNV